MNSIIRTISALVISVPVFAGVGWADPGTPKQQYSAIFKEYSPVSGGMRVAKTDLERRAGEKSIDAALEKLIREAEETNAAK
ncbi:MAG: hypothetical protein O3C40_16715 [Planctomycetota bacterium]|nr:hypothetical protein [Planctomycetota bacterium]